MKRHFMRIVTVGLIIGCADTAFRGCSKSMPTPPTATTPPKPPPPTPKPAPATLPTATQPHPSEVTPTTAPITVPAPMPSAQMSLTSPTRPDMVAPANDKVATFMGFAGPKPATWIWHPPQGTMSVLEYSVPGVDGADQGKIVVIPARGSLDANIQRWKGQFRDAAGNIGAIEPKVDKFDVNGLPVTLVEIAGEYKGMGATNFAPDQLFLTAVLAPPTSDDQIFVRFTGPRKTVEANRAAFVAMIKGLQRVEPQK